MRKLHNSKANRILDELEPLLGTVTDKVLAERFNLSHFTVRYLRHKYNIPPKRTNRPERIAAVEPEILKSLGKISDKKIAKLHNISNHEVSKLRKKHNIPKCPQEKSLKKTRS